MDGATRNCPNCGVPVREGWKFCGKCRAPIPAPRESAAPSSSVPWARPARANVLSEPNTAAAVATRDCPACHSAVEEDGGDFCEHCGAKLTPAQDAARKPDAGTAGTARYKTPSEPPSPLASRDTPPRDGVEEVAPQSPQTTAASTGTLTPPPNGATGFVKVSLGRSETVKDRSGRGPGETLPRADAITGSLPGNLDDLYRDLAPPPTQTAGHPTIPARALIMAGAALAVALVTVVLFVSLRRTGGELNSNGNPPATPSKGRTDVAPEGMVFVPGATFQMGRDDGDEYERPAHAATVQPFYIDKYEVTREQYAAYLRETGAPPPTSWKSAAVSPDEAKLPVTGVDWVEANAYARWAHKRLPTEEEWELAARSTDGRRYPWGNDWQDGKANAGEHSAGRVVTVGSFPDGKSPYGALDMIGNAWEWTSSDLKAYPGGSLPTQADEGNMKVIRGGYWGSRAAKATTTFRTGWPAHGNYDYGNTTIRCAMSVQSGSTQTGGGVERR